MSKSLNNAAQAQFESFVKHAYQAEGGTLRKTVRVKTGVVGSTHRFNKMGKGVATPRVPQSDVIPMGIGHSNVTCSLTDWNAPEYTDIFDQATTSVDEKRELASVIANAIKRREDQMIIDALDAAAASAQVSKDIGGANTDMNSAKARKAKALMDAAGVPKTDRTMLIHANGLNNGMLAENTTTSSDWNTVKALVQGEINTWLGFTWETMEDRDEGGLALPPRCRSRLSRGGHRGTHGRHRPPGGSAGRRRDGHLVPHHPHRAAHRLSPGRDAVRPRPQRGTRPALHDPATGGGTHRPFGSPRSVFL